MASGNLVSLTKFRNEDDAIKAFEAFRWPNGAACPHCGGADPYKLTWKAPKPGKRAARKGLWKCRACRKQFTATVGTIFESSHIPVSKWMMAVHLLCASKKGMSAHQLHRMLGITYRAAWFMAHRLRHAMATGDFLLDGTVEADETYVGGKRKGNNGRYPAENKIPVMALVERRGRVKAFPLHNVTSRTLQEEVRKRVKKSAAMMTDDMAGYHGLKMGFKSHDTIKHSAGEYVRGDVHTNTVEGFFSLLKRGIVGTFHHVSKGHLHRYCDEFAFRYSNRSALGVDDGERAQRLIAATAGKRLTFKQPSGHRAA